MIRRIEIIGEATAYLSEETRREIAALPSASGGGIFIRLITIHRRESRRLVLQLLPSSLEHSNPQ